MLNTPVSGALRCASRAILVLLASASSVALPVAASPPPVSATSSAGERGIDTSSRLALAQLNSGLADGLGQIGTGLGNGLGQIGTGLGNGLGQINTGLGVVFSHVGGDYLEPTPGTVGSEGYIVSDGLSRRYILIRPTVAVAGAPVLMMLHAHGLAPERMANLVGAGRIAADYGAWVYLPEGVQQDWNDDPAVVFGPDDVAFLRRLIDREVSANKLDAKRVFVAGYSNGGFMAERLGCELSSRIAGLATVAATLRDDVASTCVTAHNMPVAQFQGTSDFVVPYSGILYSLKSAPASAAFWAERSHCTAGTFTSQLANPSNDGTSVTLTRYTNCPAGTGVRLYTIDHGGHTWPDSNYPLYTVELGRTSLDINATQELWRFFSGYSNP